MGPEAEAKAGMQFEMVYCETGERKVVVESVELVVEREGGNKRLGVDFCRW